MAIKLIQNSYGKAKVRVVKLIRHETHHEFREVEVKVLLEGDFETAHTIGDNSKVLPTDTMKNTVFALARENFTGSIEEFGIFLSNHFLNQVSHLTKTTIELEENIWHRMDVSDADGTTTKHPHTYISGGNEKWTAKVVNDRNSVKVTAGIYDLKILKTTDSAFAGYLKDEYTILKETHDRIFATSVKTNWSYQNAQQDFKACRQQIRTALLNTFAYHKSLSAQHTLHDMGKAALEQCEAIKDISIEMPNIHNIPYNLKQFGIDNSNEVSIATSDPFGLITGTLARV